jgi:ribose transport system ATP-binding protein
MTTTSRLLTLRGIRKSYGSIEVLHGIDMHVDAGEVVALLGENGAGKSTVSNLISGVVQPDSGTMSLLDKPYAPKSPRAALDAGVGMIHQELLLLPDLTIAENMFVGRYPMRAGRVDRSAMNTLATGA